MKGLGALLFLAGFSVAAAIDAVFVGPIAPPTTVYPTTAVDTALGFTLRAGRTAFGLTQDSLSKLTSRTVTATKISRLERGLDTATVAQQDSLALALLRVARARIPAAARTRLWWIAVRNWRRS